MDKKHLSVGALGGAVVTAVVVLIATNFVNNAGDTLNAGEDAKITSLVKEVLIEETSVAVNGKTLTTSEALSLILSNQSTIKTELAVVSAQIDILTED